MIKENVQQKYLGTDYKNIYDTLNMEVCLLGFISFIYA